MADQAAPETAAQENAPAPKAEAPAAKSADRAIKLTDYVEVLGEMRTEGKVIVVPAAEADRLIGAGKAKEATAFDRKIAGLVE
jgi:hypothetical protein